MSVVSGEYPKEYPTGVKRVHYSNGQFLEAEDFTIEQDYHKGMLREHNKNIHGWGVVEGFDVINVADKKVTISDGMAIDNQGRQIIQETAEKQKDYTLAVSVGEPVYLYYNEELTDRSPDACISDPARCTETPRIKTDPNDDGVPGINLGKEIDDPQKQYCPLRVLSKDLDEPPYTVKVTGNLSVTGTVIEALVGAAQSLDGQEKYKIVAGTASDWEPEPGQYPTYFDVVVDTTSANFNNTPMYFVSVAYDGVPANEIKSATVYNATSIEFRVRYWGTDSANLSINWTAIGE
ncbi:MAG TPA: hypothetical protein EYP59_04990 [Thiotrichaceae bacterium]|nr:hypothetical protein [Thiotrichaceae bacterium]